MWVARKFSMGNDTIPDIFHNVVKRHPDKPCFLFKDETWTFQQVCFDDSYCFLLCTGVFWEGYHMLNNFIYP